MLLSYDKIRATVLIEPQTKYDVQDHKNQICPNVTKKLGKNLDVEKNGKLFLIANGNFFCVDVGSSSGMHLRLIFLGPPFEIVTQ